MMGQALRQLLATAKSTDIELERKELNLIQEKKRNFAADETKTKVGSSIPDLEDGWKQAPQGNYIL